MSGEETSGTPSFFMFCLFQYVLGKDFLHLTDIGTSAEVLCQGKVASFNLDFHICIHVEGTGCFHGKAVNR